MKANNRKYKIYPQHNFGYAKLLPGKYSFKEIYEFAKLFREDKDFSTVYYMLTDIRSTHFDFGIRQIKNIIKLVNEYSKTDHQKIGVYLIDTPMETAYAKIFFKTLNRKRDYCFTVEKAYSLLNIPVTFERFLELINI